MKPLHVSLTVVAAALALPAVAAAQPSAAPAGGGGYYAQPPGTAGGYHQRAGVPMIGFSLGLGGMNIDDSKVECASCDYSPIGVEADFHIGGMLSDRFALMLELQGNAETVDSDRYGSTSLVQYTAMLAGQYWLTPQLWIKGGIGAAHLSYEYDDDYYGTIDSEPVDDGAVVMAAIGYELLSARNFSIDLQGRVISAAYDGIDRNVSAATIGVGFNWFGFGRSGALIVVR